MKGTYLHLFETEADFKQARENNYIEPWVSVTNTGNDEYRVDYNKSEYEKLLGTPLTFKITSNGNIVWKAQNTSYTKKIQYCKNGGEWTSITATTAGTSFSVVSGDTVQFRGDNATYSSGASRYNTFIGTTCGFKTYGNIMSLIDSTGFTTATTLQSGYTFIYFFRNCTGLTDASKLVLPATTLANYCYYSMFSGCTSLTSAPELPATTLAQYCYQSMFGGCTSLTTAPELPATTLAQGCYSNMFYDCTSLTTAPALPAMTLEDFCYNYMFTGCTSLTTAPELPATTLAQYCYSYMFTDCTSLTSAPELPATTLANYCYSYMFYGCSNLNYIKCLATNISANSCTSSWVSGVASSGTFVKNPNIVVGTGGWSRGTSGIPTNWTVEDAS